jgi:hypothetical protein
MTSPFAVQYATLCYILSRCYICLINADHNLIFPHHTLHWSRLQAAFRKFYGRYNDLVCQYNLPLAEIMSLSRSLHIDLDYGLFRLPDLEKGFMADVIGQHGMLTPPRNLIPSLVYPEVHVCPILWFVFPTRLMRLMTVRYVCQFVYYYIFITYLLLYPVDIGHYINFYYYTVYFYATHNV